MGYYAKDLHDLQIIIGGAELWGVESRSRCYHLPLTNSMTTTAGGI